MHGRARTARPAEPGMESSDVREHDCNRSLPAPRALAGVVISAAAGWSCRSCPDRRALPFSISAMGPFSALTRLACRHRVTSDGVRIMRRCRLGWQPLLTEPGDYLLDERHHTAGRCVGSPIVVQ